MGYKMDKLSNQPKMESVWEELRGYLEKKKRQIGAEILHYPPPIPACDAQFNFLLEERTRIAQEIGRLENLAQESRTHPNPLQLIEAFVVSSTDMDDQVKQKFMG